MFSIHTGQLTVKTAYLYARNDRIWAMSWILYMEAHAIPPDFLSHPGSLTTEDASHSKLAEGYVYFSTSHIVPNFER